MNEKIPLARHVSLIDGGRSIGLGSLSAYRVCILRLFRLRMVSDIKMEMKVHINDRPLHVLSRDERLEQADSGLATLPEELPSRDAVRNFHKYLIGQKD